MMVIKELDNPFKSATTAKVNEVIRKIEELEERVKALEMKIK